MDRPLHLDIRHYETVVALVDHPTMTEAARQLAVTQSAMSHRLAETERRLGVTLFHRGADRRLTPTTSGVAFSQAARRALDELLRIEDMMIGTASEIVATVRIGVGGYEAFHWYPSFLLRARDERPDVELDLMAIGDAPGPPLASRTVDLVLAPGQPAGDHEMAPAFTDELVLLCAPDHPLAGESTVAPGDLVDDTYLTYNALPSPGFEYDRFIRPAGDAPRIVRVVRQTSAIVELVAAGVGVSILSQWATAPAVEAGRVVAVRCGTEGIPITWHTAHRRGDALAADIASRLAGHLSPT